MIRISTHQLFCLIILFEIGSTTLFPMASDAKQDAWIVLAFTMVTGLIVLWIYTEIHRSFPQKNLIEIIIVLLGKTLGIPLAFCYTFYFILVSQFNFSEFGTLIKMTLLEETPQFIILSIFMLLTVYIFFLGFEVFGRTSEIVMPLMILMLVSTYVLIAISGHMDFRELSPVFVNLIPTNSKEGLELFHLVLNYTSFPYGETVVFLMYYCYVNEKRSIRRTAFLASSIMGVEFVILSIITISVLGVSYGASATVPFFELVKIVNVGDIITNLDAIAVIAIFIGGLYKMGIFLYGGILGLSTIFKIKDKKWLIIGACSFVLFFSLSKYTSYPYYRKSVIKVLDKNSAHYIYVLCIPPLLLIMHWLKKWNQKLTKVKRYGGQ